MMQDRVRSVLITGCGANGIGAALAREFHRRGHRVFAPSHTIERVNSELGAIGVTTFVMDVTSSDSIKDAVQRVSIATDGRLDILINNAGLIHVMPFADTPIEEVRSLFEVNFFGAWAVTQAFLPLLLEAKGVVANMGSLNNDFCPPLFSAYSASKGAIQALGSCMRKELAPLGVRVVTLKTGSVRSGLFDHIDGHTIPDDSMYASLRGFVQERGFLRGANFIEADEYTRLVVGDLLAENVKPLIWRGGLTTVAWLLSWFGWETILDNQMIKGFGLDKIRYISPRSS